MAYHQIHAVAKKCLQYAAHCHMNRTRAVQWRRPWHVDTSLNTLSTGQYKLHNPKEYHTIPNILGTAIWNHLLTPTSRTVAHLHTKTSKGHFGASFFCSNHLYLSLVLDPYLVHSVFPIPLHSVPRPVSTRQSGCCPHRSTHGTSYKQTWPLCQQHFH